VKLKELEFLLAIICVYFFYIIVASVSIALENLLNKQNCFSNNNKKNIN
jgi:hypothetical protein